jgi:UDP-N-acetylglucosamine acyltransferase
MNKIKYTIDRSAVIGKNVEIMEGVIIGPNVIIGDNVRIFPYAVIGMEAQYKDKVFALEDKKIFIGSGTIIREFVTIHSPSNSNSTYVGKNCYLMATSHVAHDCYLGNDVVLCNSANLGGYTKVGNNTTLGLNVSTHQHSEIGSCCMIGAQSFFKGKVSTDGIMWIGAPAQPVKVNVRGIERADLSEQESQRIIMEANTFLRNDFRDTWGLHSGK